MRFCKKIFCYSVAFSSIRAKGQRTFGKAPLNFFGGASRQRTCEIASAKPIKRLKMHRKRWIIFGILAFAIGARAQQDALERPLVNPGHLDHLYEEVSVNGKSLGTVWIYCEAPDYRLVGDEDEGFTCVDDVARALVFYCRAYRLAPSDALLKKIRSLTAFLQFMQAENGFFYNFLLPGGTINTTHQNSRAVASWWSWRAFWAISELHLITSPSLVDLQRSTRPILDTLAAAMSGICPDPSKKYDYEGITLPQCLGDLGADQVSVMVIGLANYYRAYPGAELKNLLLFLGNLLLADLSDRPQGMRWQAFLSWQNYWHAWGNTQAYALLLAGKALGHTPFLEAGRTEVRDFYPWVLEQGFLNAFRLTGEKGVVMVRDVNQFSQIAYAVSPMLLAALEAYSVQKTPGFAKTAGQLAAWFLGNNPAGQPMYDPSSGRTYDGIGSQKDINRNAGAESTIEGLLALQALDAVPQARRQMEKFLKKKRQL
jgi:hypothetical protein